MLPNEKNKKNKALLCSFTANEEIICIKYDIDLNNLYEKETIINNGC